METRRYTVLTEQERENFRRQCKILYEAGLSIREVAQATGRSYGTVHQALIDEGVEMRPRGKY